MKQVKFVFSLLLAVVLLFAIALPTLAATPETTNSVTLHKRLLSQSELDNWTHPDKYDATQNMTDFSALVGRTLEEIAGVYFAFQNEAGQWVDATGAVVTSVDLALGGLTTTTGYKFDTSQLPAGIYKIVEVQEKSTYVGPNNETLTGSLAVPVILTLPVVNDTGVVADAHVYPKNVESKPTIDKDYADATTIIDEQRNAVVGTVLPYKVTTTIPVNAQYQTLEWGDTMTSGLTYNNDLVVSIGGAALTAGTHYTVTQTATGFYLEFLANGLALVNDKATPTVVTLTYSATLNDAAVVAVPERNSITLVYGNSPSNGNTPINVTPNNSQIALTKTWSTGTAPTGVEAVFDVYDATTNTIFTTVTLNAANGWSATITGLDDTKEYRIVERYIKGYAPEYTSSGAGVLNVKNWPDNNPGPLTPEAPSVVTGGKKFIKTTTDGTTPLAGAQFVVTRTYGSPAVTQYLALKDTTTQSTELANYLAAEKAYQDAVALATTENPDTANIATLKAARDAAYAAVSMQWTWVDAQTGAFVFTSAQDGSFEVTGLAYGSYALVEVKAPTGYATISGNIDFTVDANSYSATATAVPHVLTATNQQIIENKLITIPQTGGIGTIVFAVVGLLLMIGAVIFYKKRSSDEAESEQL